MMQGSLRLVVDHTSHTTHHTTQQQPAAGHAAEPREAGVLKLWTHWMELLRHDMPVARSLSPVRRAAIEQALVWGFEVNTIELAIEGCAGSAWCAGANRARLRFDDLGWILQNEERIERLAAEGAKGRAALAREQAAPPSAPVQAGAQTEAQRTRLAELRAYLARVSGRR